MMQVERISRTRSGDGAYRPRYGSIERVRWGCRPQDSGTLRDGKARGERATTRTGSDEDLLHRETGPVEGWGEPRARGGHVRYPGEDKKEGAPGLAVGRGRGRLGAEGVGVGSVEPASRGRERARSVGPGRGLAAGRRGVQEEAGEAGG